MKKRHWLYLASALLWGGTSGNAAYHHRLGFAALTGATAVLNLVLFERVRRHIQQ